MSNTLALISTFFTITLAFSFSFSRIPKKLAFSFSKMSCLIQLQSLMHLHLLSSLSHLHSLLHLQYFGLFDIRVFKNLTFSIYVLKLNLFHYFDKNKVSDINMIHYNAFSNDKDMKRGINKGLFSFFPSP